MMKVSVVRAAATQSLDTIADVSALQDCMPPGASHSLTRILLVPVSLRFAMQAGFLSR